MEYSQEQIKVFIQGKCLECEDGKVFILKSSQYQRGIEYYKCNQCGTKYRNRYGDVSLFNFKLNKQSGN